MEEYTFDAGLGYGKRIYITVVKAARMMGEAKGRETVHRDYVIQLINAKRIVVHGKDRMLGYRIPLKEFQEFLEQYKIGFTRGPKPRKNKGAIA